MKIKGAIFDMDGTIVDSLMFWDDLWRRIGEKYMGSPDFKPNDEVNKNVRTMVYTDAMAYFREYYGLPVTTEEFVRFTANGVTEFYRDVARPKQGAIAFLNYLKENNVKICLASATAMSEIMFALKCYDMLKYFDVVLSCADIGIGKDRPDIYLMSRDKLGLPENELCVFEDSFIALETAKKAGFQTVGVYDRYNFNQERLKKASDIYLGEGQGLDTLIGTLNI